MRQASFVFFFCHCSKSLCTLVFTRFAVSRETQTLVFLSLCRTAAFLSFWLGENGVGCYLRFWVASVACCLRIAKLGEESSCLVDVYVLLVCISQTGHKLLFVCPFSSFLLPSLLFLNLPFCADTHSFHRLLRFSLSAVVILLCV